MPDLLISLLHPTVRPEFWRYIALEWQRTCDRPEFVEYVLVPERKFFPGLPNAASTLFQHSVIQFNEEAASTVGGYNFAARISHGKVLVTIADDFYPAKHWDTDILDLLRDKMNQEIVIQVDTGMPQFDDHFIPLPILTRKYYERSNYIFWPEYTSYYADADFTGMAKAEKIEIINARDTLKFRHVQGGRGGQFSNDKYYKRNGTNAEFSGNLYNKRLAAGFPR